MARDYNTGRTEAEVVYMTPDPMGIRDVRFLKAEFVPEDRDKKINEYLRISFRQEGSGALGSYMESDVDEKQYPKNEIYSDKRGPDAAKRSKFDKACDDQDARLKHVFGAITGIDYNEKGHVIEGVSSFKDYCEAFIATINVEQAKKVKIHWLKMTWYVSKVTGKAKSTMGGFPPFISSELKPRDWKPSEYDVKNRVFFRPVTQDNQSPDEEEEEVPVGATSPQVPYGAAGDDEVYPNTSVGGEDEDIDLV